MAALAGGDALERKLAEIAASMGSGHVRVGFMEGADYPGGPSVAQVAFWNEYGHGGRFPAPPRPFFRTMIAAESPGWAMKLGGAIKFTGYNRDAALRVMGEDISGALQHSIRELTAPELSATTKMLRKMFGNNSQEIRARDVLEARSRVAEGGEGASGTQAKPLIWTGNLINSVTYQVKDGVNES